MFKIGDRIRFKQSNINKDIEQYIQRRLNNNRYGTIIGPSHYHDMIQIRFDNGVDGGFFPYRFELVENDMEEYV